MNFKDIDVHWILPQQEPFVMIDSLEHFDMGKTVTSTTIREDNIFTDGGNFSPSGLIENIAQTCAARVGYINKYILKKGIRLGFIGSIRKLRINRLPKAGERITTTIITIEEVFGMTLVSAAVCVGDETLADAQMKIAVSEMESHSTAQ